MKNVNPEVFLLFVALAVALAAAVTDVQQHRISNKLTYPAFGIGLLLRSYFYGWHGLLSGLGGFLLAGGIVFIFYAVRAMGAGDLKLLAALGAVVGTQDVITILLATAIAGGVVALIYIAIRGRLGKTLRNLGSLLKFHFLAGWQAHPELNLDNPEALRMPYGIAIAAGTLYTFVSVWWR